jgi:hypothetical protein
MEIGIFAFAGLARNLDFGTKRRRTPEISAKSPEKFPKWCVLCLLARPQSRPNLKALLT